MNARLKMAPLWVALAALSLPARAEDSTSAARAVFAAARDAYGRGNYGDASRGFEEAYRMTSRPELLFDIAQSQRQLKDFARAGDLYQQYLEVQPDSPRAGLVRELLAEMRARPTRLALAAPPEAPAPGVSLLSPEPGGELSATGGHRSGGLLQSPWFWGGVAIAAGAIAGGVLLATVKPPGPAAGSLGVVDLR